MRQAVERDVQLFHTAIAGEAAELLGGEPVTLSGKRPKLMLGPFGFR